MIVYEYRGDSVAHIWDGYISACGKISKYIDNEAADETSKKCLECTFNTNNITRIKNLSKKTPKHI